MTYDEIAELDMKTIETRNIYCGLHPRADINRLYSLQHKGERGLRYVKYTILSEQMTLQEYMFNKRLTEQLLNTIWQSNKCHVLNRLSPGKRNFKATVS